MMFVRTILLPFLIILFVVLSAFAIVENRPKRTPDLAEILPPKQPYYAVFYIVCGKFQTVLMTTEPPLMGFAGEPESPELLDLLKATPFERIIELRYVGPECYLSKQAEPIYD